MDMNVLENTLFERNRNQLYFSTTVNYIEHWTNLLEFPQSKLNIKRRKFDSIIRLMYCTVLFTRVPYSERKRKQLTVLCAVREPMKRYSGKRAYTAKWEMKTRHIYTAPYGIRWDTICQSDVITQSWWSFFVVVSGDAPRIFNFSSSMWQCVYLCIVHHTFPAHTIDCHVNEVNFNFSKTICYLLYSWDAHRRIKLNGHTFVTLRTIERKDRERAPFKIGE